MPYYLRTVFEKNSFLTVNEEARDSLLDNPPNDHAWVNGRLSMSSNNACSLSVLEAVED